MKTSHVEKIIAEIREEGINGYYCTNCGSSAELEELVWDIQDKPHCPYCAAEGHVELHAYYTGNGTKPFGEGDTVFWKDPADNDFDNEPSCSRRLTIASITGRGDNEVVIEADDGWTLECYGHELVALYAKSFKCARPYLDCKDCDEPMQHIYTCAETGDGICKECKDKREAQE